MSEQPDQSHYEILLTNRQVMSIFVVLLVCVLAAFLGGVWLGRGADAGVEMASAQSITAGVTPGEEPLQELEFFAQRDESKLDQAKGAAPPAESPPFRAAAEPGRAPEPVAPGPEAGQPAPPSVSAPPAAAEPAAADPPPVEPGPAEQHPAESEPAQLAESVQSAPAEPEAAAVPELVVIQVFSSTEQAQARRVFNRLRKGGYPAIISPVEVDGRTLHRVRIGPYTDRDEAQVVAESVRRTFKLDTWITH